MLLASSIFEEDRVKREKRRLLVFQIQSSDDESVGERESTNLVGSN